MKDRKSVWQYEIWDSQNNMNSFDITSCTIEVATSDHETLRSRLTQLNMGEEKSCSTTLHKYCNQSKRIIYIQEYDTYIAKFENELKCKYDIAEVTQADFFKGRNEHSTLLLITFNNDSVPQTLYIPGEKSEIII